MINTFQGIRDASAIIVKNIFPDSNLIISTPFAFESKRSGVYLEGNLEHLEAAFEYSKNLVDSYFDDHCCGRWIGISPPDAGVERLIIHYEALSDLDKIQLLNFMFPKQLAKICDLCISAISTYLVKVNGKIVQTGMLILPENFIQGKKLLSSKLNVQKTTLGNESIIH